MSEKHTRPPEDLRRRTKQFAVRIVRLYVALSEQGAASQVIGKQLLRSGTSVGAQYREAFRARSRGEFVSKIQSALQELEETQYWFEVLIESELLTEERLRPLVKEADELTAIFVASVKTAKRAAKGG